MLLSTLKTLKPCRLCGTPVAPKALTCPHCGEPYPVKRVRLVHVVAALLATLLLFVVVTRVVVG